MLYESESPSEILVKLNNTADTANVLLAGGWLEAALDSSGDVDYFSLYAESAGLIRLDFGNALTTATAIWQIDLLNYAGDYLSLLGANSYGAPVVSGTANTGTSLLVSGLSSAVPIGSRFTFSTSSADTVIYTVKGATKPSGGQSTLTLDKALSGALSENTPLVFSPTQTSVAGLGLTGASTSITTSVATAGNYFFKVSAANWQSDTYQLKASFEPTIETLLNDTKALAVQEGNRLLADAWMTGALSTANDVDNWVFTTASASDFNIDFAASSGDDSAPEWEITLSEWNGAPLTTLQGVALGGSVGKSGSYSIDSSKYTTGATYVVTVKAATGTHDSGNYTLRLHGDGLDLNDTPVMTVGSVSSGLANQPIQTGVVRTLDASTASHSSSLALEDLFSVSDADTTQTLRYKAWLTTADGQATGQIQIGDDSTSYTNYTNGTLMTADQMAKARVLAGTTTGALSLEIQAFDSSWVADADVSGSSARMSQTISLLEASTPSGVDLSGSVRFWKNSAIKLDGVSVSAPGHDPVQSAAGGFALTGLSTAGVSPLVLTANKTISVSEPSEAGINLSDVLGALKVYLKKDTSSPFKYIASDFDGNGKVELTDVLSLLKFYLKKPNATQPSWAFMDASDISDTGIAAAGTGQVSLSAAQPDGIDVDLQVASSVQLVGVLRGDVDGSWAPPSLV